MTNRLEKSKTERRTGWARDSQWPNLDAQAEDCSDREVGGALPTRAD